MQRTSNPQIAGSSPATSVSAQEYPSLAFQHLLKVSGGLKKEPLMDLEDVIEAARRAKDAGSTRFCLGAAWRGPRDQDLYKVDIRQSIVRNGVLKCRLSKVNKFTKVEFYKVF